MSLALLVEDSPTQSLYYEELLISMGLEVHTVADATSALEVAYTVRPDVIVLDINLPDMDGFQVCARLQRIPETRDIPVIILTARDTPDDAWAGLEAGALGYVPKDDYVLETLQMTIEQLQLWE